jgi:FkbM family methyltransferase
MKLTHVKTEYKNGTLSKPDYIDQMHGLHKVLFEYASFLSGTDIRHIEISDDSVIMTSRAAGIKLVCDKDDKRIIPIEILNFDFYEKENIEMVLDLIQDGMNVFDIGANIGWYSLNVAKARKDVKLFAFEPIPKTFQYLQKNLALNNARNVQAFNFGFSNEEKDITFFYTPEGSGNTSLVNLSGSPAVEKISSKVKKMDQFTAAHQIRVDFIKCDVEGAELFVYLGGIDTLKRDKPIIFTEMLRKWSAKFNYHPNEIIELLKKHDYHCFVVKGRSLTEFYKMDENTEETNFFFLHSAKHAHLISGLAK